MRENVDVVLVQGHTDERGTVAYNRELSAKRANAVLNYMFEANPSLEQTYGGYFASSAYSEFRPVDSTETEAALPAATAASRSRSCSRTRACAR